MLRRPRSAEDDKGIRGYERFRGLWDVLRPDGEVAEEGKKDLASDLEASAHTAVLRGPGMARRDTHGECRRFGGRDALAGEGGTLELRQSRAAHP